ncbi:MAG: hypothetical protein JWR61_4514 [Ferruginibacter sp.]|nr:hypothetical protein [Ferruginibacter sp.]
MVKNSILKSVTLILTATVIFAACKKDDSPAVPDKVSKLMVPWKIKAITTPKAGQPAADSSIYKDCMSDDIIQFSNNGYDFQDGTVKCDSTAFRYSKGSWAYKIAADSIQLSSNAPVKYASWKVVTLNDTALVVRYTDSTNPATKIVKTISFKH